MSDRAHSAASQLKKGDIAWEAILGGDGTRWLHTGGIFAALSATTPEVILEAVVAAKRHGVVVSYDLNYRPSLWKFNGGQPKAREVNLALAPYIDVMIGNEEDSPPRWDLRFKDSMPISRHWTQPIIRR